MFQDTYIVTDDSLLTTLGERYAVLLPRFFDAERLFAQVKQAKGDLVAMHTALYAERELNFEVAHLRLFLATRAMHSLLQPVWDEAQAVRRKSKSFLPTIDTAGVRQNNVIATEDLYNMGSALYWEYRIARYDVHHFQAERVFKMQNADPNCFIYEHGDPALESLTCAFKVLHELYARSLTLAEGIKSAKSNCVQQSEGNKALYLDRQRRYEGSIAAYRHCVLQFHRLLQPLFEATHSVRCAQDLNEHVFDEVAVRRICVAAAEGLYKRAHAAFYAAIEQPQEYAGLTESYDLEPANPRVFLMRDEVELKNPLPPPPYQTREEAVRAGNKWVGFANYASDVIVDTRVPQPTTTRPAV